MKSYNSKLAAVSDATLSLGIIILSFLKEYWNVFSRVAFWEIGFSSCFVGVILTRLSKMGRSAHYGCHHSLRYDPGL